MNENDQNVQRLIEAARPLAKLAENCRHRPYVDARVPATLLLSLADALAAVDEAQQQCGR